MPSRLQMTARNAFWSYCSMVISLTLSFIHRTIFIRCLGEGYLGINGLFSNVLGVLSFAELGIGTAIGFSLYKPVAHHDIEKIKSYMYYFKWAYRWIALIITILGLSLVPFLDHLVKDPGNVGNIKLYYLIFLFNTVTSYFVSYKFSLVGAEQKNYIFTNINLVISLIATAVNIATLLIWKNFLVYLLIAAAYGLLNKFFIVYYFNKKYPYLRETKVAKLSKDELHTLISKIKALLIHKIGGVCVHSTDNIIVSAFVSTKVVGYLSNYNLIIGTVSSCISILFNSVTGSLGNMIATETKEYQYTIFQRYRFIGFWFFGFSSIALAILMSPFITLWIGERMVIDQLVINLIIINYYMIGHRICLSNVKSAGGIFEPDKWIALIQAIVNLVVSIALVKVMGLPGVFIGTVVQGLISTIGKPILCYKQMFGLSSRYYFIDSLKYGSAVIVAYCLCELAGQFILATITIPRFIVMMGVVTIVPNLIFLIGFYRTAEFKYFLELLCKLYNNRIRPIFCK